MDDVFRARDGDTPLEPKLALAGADASPASTTALSAQGLREKVLVVLRFPYSNFGWLRDQLRRLLSPT